VKIKQLMGEMQIYVKEHQHAISSKLVNDDKLSITVELMEATMDERLKRDLEKLHDRLKPSIKKRIKMKHIESKLLTKTNVVEFNKTVQRLDDKIQLLGDRVDYKLPSMEYEFERALKNKAELEMVEKLVDTKVDKTFVDSLIDRINKIEEMAAAKAKVVEVKRPTESEEDENEQKEVVNEDGTASPSSPRKKKKAAREVDSEDEAREAEERKKASEAQKALQEMVEKL
jgi:hypothetical protein